MESTAERGSKFYPKVNNKIQLVVDDMRTSNAVTIVKESG
jgi:hypothetical protein